MSTWASTFTTTTTPYFAPADSLPAPLPSYEETADCQDLLPENQWEPMDRDLLHINDHYVAKYGRYVLPIEVENMFFVKKHCPNIIMPTVYAMYTRESTGNNVIIMEHIRGGECLYDVRNRRLKMDQKKGVMAQLQSYLDALHSIPSDSPEPYYGHFGKRPFPSPARFSGPFSSAHDFNAAHWQTHALHYARDGKVDDAILKLTDAYQGWFEGLTAGNDAPVFCHGQFSSTSIMIRDDGKAVLTNWESAGFWPAYTECLPDAWQHKTWRQLNYVPREVIMFLLKARTALDDRRFDLEHDEEEDRNRTNEAYQIQKT
ncbi:hypothetical protein F5B20DRAFT_579841 [Whalleya microplaca]|nr:hypothetical protein F5B20DRAFT_579841 [Whalleya microplaca]